MAGPGQSDAGCLSILASCFEKPRKGRSQTRNSSNRAGTTAPSASIAIRSSLRGRTSHGSHALSSRDAETLASSSSAGLQTPSSHAAGQDPISPRADKHNSAVCNSPGEKLSLWQEACNLVDPKTRTWIDSIPSNAIADDPVKELVDIVRRAEEKHMKESPKLTVGDRDILWRDYANRVVSVVTAIGDVAIAFSPAPSTAVWSAVKALLQANVTQCEDLVAIMGCADRVLCCVRRGRVYEEVYICDSPESTDSEHLRQVIIEAYKGCLDFLFFVKENLRKKNLSRFLLALVDPGQGEKRVAKVKALEEDMRHAALACDARAGSEHRKLLLSLEAPLKRVDDGVAAVLTRLETHDRMRAMNYISNVPVGAHHNEKIENRTKGTCEWLTRHSEFRKWEDAACSSIFWLQGDIGTGKSFLSSKVIGRYMIRDQATQTQYGDGDEGFAFFYCDRGDPTRRNFRSIMRSYIRQLSEIPRRTERIHESAYALYKKREQIQNDIDIKDCEIALAQMIDSYPKTTIVLDALDECEQESSQQLAELFKRLLQTSIRPLKVFIASRPQSDIEDCFSSFESPRMLIRISTKDNLADIEKFVTEAVDNSPMNWKRITPETKKLVCDTLVNTSDGMFRWAYLQLEQLKQLNMNSDIMERLGKLPPTLSTLYDEIYGQCSEGHERVLLQRAIRWVLCARDPMKTSTLLAAIRAETLQADGENSLSTSDINEDTLKIISRNLIVVDSKLEVWKFPHASVAEHFEAKGDCCSNLPPDLLSLNDQEAIQSWMRKENEEPDNYLNPRHPFQRYIQRNWLHHIHHLSDQDCGTDVAQALKGLLGATPQTFSTAYPMLFKYFYASGMLFDTFLLLAHGFELEMVKPGITFVFAIVTMGLHRSLRGWWDMDLDPTLLPDLLIRAIFSRHTDLARDIICRGCDLNRDVEQQEHSALGMSIYCGNIEITRLLLDKGADPNRPHKHTFLCQAALMKRFEHVQLLLEAGADHSKNCSNMPGGQGERYECYFGSALVTAAYHGQIDILRALVDRGADVNPTIRAGRFGSPLAAAVTMHRIDCARFLLEQGAKVNMEMRFGVFGSALAAAAASRERDLGCLKLLVEHGADPTSKPKFGVLGSPLAAAAFGDWVEGARFLIDHGAAVNDHLEFGQYGSALAAAVMHSRGSMVKFLIEEQNADPGQLAVFGPRAPQTLELAEYWAAGTRGSQAVREYLIRDCHVDAGFLLWLGISPERMPPGYKALRYS
ncbi:ankyrin protein [Cordyceps javanica]|uniref:Ankyrin protein n=1 Tax=Cordyceps javanica TaxID=43265 RepID=A0A545URD4_9HYPO|nr:ankyrin protein [Cordyceps javanica]TQW04196.1 ankyrin protein [Cordyceps javanica]